MWLLPVDFVKGDNMALTQYHARQRHERIRYAIACVIIGIVSGLLMLAIAALGDIVHPGINLW
jgi:hypothetical protein